MSTSVQHSHWGLVLVSVAAVATVVLAADGIGSSAASAASGSAAALSKAAASVQVPTRGGPTLKSHEDASIPNCVDFDSCVAASGGVQECCGMHFGIDRTCAICLKAGCHLRADFCLKQRAPQERHDPYCEACHDISDVEKPQKSGQPAGWGWKPTLPPMQGKPGPYGKPGQPGWKPTPPPMQGKPGPYGKPGQYGKMPYGNTKPPVLPKMPYGNTKPPVLPKMPSWPKGTVHSQEM